MNEEHDEQKAHIRDGCWEPKKIETAEPKTGKNDNQNYEVATNPKNLKQRILNRRGWNL